VNALSRVAELLVPDGILLDLHPASPSARVFAGEVELGALDEREFTARVRATERGLEEAVRLGLYAHEEERTVELRFHADSADDLLATVGDDWEEFHVPPALEAAVRAADEPLAVREDFVLRRLRRVS
jgi:hypothetical protein